MNQEEKIDKILELINKVDKEQVLTNQKLDIHLKDYEITKKSHYELKDEHTGLKAKVVIFSALIGSGITFVGTWIKNQFS